MRDVGYETFNLFMNLGTLTFLVSLYLVKVFLILFIMKPASMIFRSLKKTYRKLY
jgi:hypothetical protein